MAACDLRLYARCLLEPKRFKDGSRRRRHRQAFVPRRDVCVVVVTVSRIITGTRDTLSSTDVWYQYSHFLLQHFLENCNILVLK
jgi:hypothetical protein